LALPAQIEPFVSNLFATFTLVLRKALLMEVPSEPHACQLNQTKKDLC